MEKTVKIRKELKKATSRKNKNSSGPINNSRTSMQVYLKNIPLEVYFTHQLQHNVILNYKDFHSNTSLHLPEYKRKEYCNHTIYAIANVYLLQRITELFFKGEAIIPLEKILQSILSCDSHTNGNYFLITTSRYICSQLSTGTNSRISTLAPWGLHLKMRMQLHLHVNLYSVMRDCQ